MAIKLMGISEYARHRGCDEKSVRKAIKEGRITAIPDANGKNKIDPEVADIQWAKNTRVRASSAKAIATPASTEAGETVAPASDYKDFKALEAEQDYERKRRENDLAAGRLVERAKVDKAVFESFRTLRDACIPGIGVSVAGKVIGMTEPREIQLLVDKEVRLSFETFEQDMQRRLPRPEGYTESEGAA